MTLDRVNISDRKATFVIAATAQALGHKLDDVPISRSSIRRTRSKTRKAVAEADRAAFTPDVPLLLHWDGKLLPDIVQGRDKMDRVAILVTGQGIEKLLGVPVIPRGTGKAQADVCIQVLNEWGIKNHVRGLVFDTTASNTGISAGACTLIQEGIEHPLIFIACRHHMFEVVLSDVFKLVFGTSSGPDVQMFKRFREKWSQIVKTDFKPVEEEHLLDKDGEYFRLRKNMIEFLIDSLKDDFRRDDYAELLQLCLIFLGGVPTGGIRFRAPGALHNARWMAKAIYSIKMYLFREQCSLSARDIKNLRDISLFVSLLYVRYWHQAPDAIKAPLNDLSFVNDLVKFPSRNVADRAMAAIKRHLWYLAEELVGLALFDARISEEKKALMKVNLGRQEKENNRKRLDVKTFKPERPLEYYFTAKTMNIFDVLSTNGKQEAQDFLQKEPAEWQSNASFLRLKDAANCIAVVNDCAERGIALIQSYNSSITKDEEQKQFLLRCVDLHRKLYPTPLKTLLK